MDKRYKHLNGEERGVILAEHLRGASLGAIGLLLGRSASTIGRELLRGQNMRGTHSAQRPPPNLGATSHPRAWGMYPNLDRSFRMGYASPTRMGHPKKGGIGAP
jgi:hypothetical protein